MPVPLSGNAAAMLGNGGPILSHTTSLADLLILSKKCFQNLKKEVSTLQAMNNNMLQTVGDRGQSCVLAHRRVVCVLLLLTGCAYHSYSRKPGLGFVLAIRDAGPSPYPVSLCITAAMCRASVTD